MPQNTEPQYPVLGVLGVSEASKVMKRSPETVRKYFRTGAIRTTIFAGRTVTTLEEIRRAFGVDEHGRILDPQERAA